jgi:hypothetical protein
MLKGLLVVWVSMAWSQEYQDYSLYFTGKKIKIPITRIQNNLVNDLCAKDLKNCKAILKLKGNRSPARAITQGRMLDAFCEDMEGASLVLKNPKDQDLEFCAFEDKTLIDLSSFFYAKGGK